MLATVHDDTWNVLNMQHITPNLRRWDYSDIPGGGHKYIKGPTHMVKVATTLEKNPTPTHISFSGCTRNCQMTFDFKFYGMRYMR